MTGKETRSLVQAVGTKVRVGGRISRRGCPDSKRMEESEGIKAKSIGNFFAPSGG